jgi:hypothetical protein
MARLSKLDPLDFVNAAQDQCTYIVCLEVIFAINEERGHLNEVHFTRNVPVIVDCPFLPKVRGRYDERILL